ncbi:MAG: PAS domain S-box protein, partial [Gemmatimonadota bacterium]
MADGSAHSGYRFVMGDEPGGPTLVYDPATLRIVDASDAASELYDYSRDELLGMSVEDLRPARDAAILRELIERLDPDLPSRRRAIRHMRRDGTLIDVDLETHPLRIGDRRLRIVFIKDVTGQAERQRTLERQALLFRAMTEAVVVIDEAGTIRDWNPAAESLWGYGRDEVLGRSFDFLIPRASGVPGLLDTLRDGAEWAGAVRTQDRAGRTRLCEARFVPTHGGVENRLLAAVGIFRDVTRERVAERALAETAEGLRLLADQVPEIVWMADPEGAIYFLNDRWEEHTGAPTAVGVGRGWSEFLHPDDVDTTLSRWRNSIASGVDYLVEHRVRDQHGAYRWHLTRGRPVRSPEGSVVRWIGSSVDIHSRKTAEDEVRRREAYFRGVFENAHDAIMLFDRSTGRIIDANPGAERLYGWDAEAFRELSLADLLPDSVDAAALLEDLAAGQSTRQLHQVDRAGQDLYIEMNAASMQFRGDPVILTVNRDLTERRHLERQLRQAQKMEAVGRLAGGLAHDFNNLATAIKGFASLLGEELDGRVHAAEALAEIHRAADRATDLTRQLLAYTRQSVMRPRTVDLNGLVRSTHQLLTRLIGADIDFDLRLADGLGAVRADPSQLHQVLMNLAVNARDAMPRGGRLVIETRNVLLDREFARGHPPTLPGKYVRLRVADTGIGMTDDTRNRAFEPFFTTKGVGQGTGLGLATVYGIVKQSGGYVFVDSAPGEGARFDIYLPRVREPVSDPSESSGREGVSSVSGEARGTVLL